MLTDAETPGKRGAKPYFTGSRQALLEEFLEQYIALKRKNRNNFWFEVLSKWWKNYPWKLGDKEEPPLDNLEKMEELVSVQDGEHDKKSAVEAAVTAVSFALGEPRGNDADCGALALSAHQGLVRLPIPKPCLPH